MWLFVFCLCGSLLVVLMLVISGLFVLVIIFLSVECGFCLFAKCLWLS